MYSVPSKLSGDYHPNSPHPGNMPEGYDHEYSMARSELSTIISAAKRLRKKMKGEGNIEAWVQSKITKAADYLDTAADYVDSGEMQEQIVGGSVKLKPGKGLGGSVLSYPQGEAPKKHGDKEPKLPRLQQAHYEPDGEVIDEKCWSGYKKKGMKTMFGKRYPNCVKAEEFSNWREELFEQKGYVMPSASQSGAYSGGSKDAYRVGDTIPASATKPKPSLYQRIKAAGDKYGKKSFQEDWQSVNRKDKTDGLSQKAVDAYRRENPGSKLQTAVTERKPKGKRAKRRASFCRRMKGHKAKNTSAKTARDPDSRINKALRRWNCN